jgi:hypothetical protein
MQRLTLLLAAGAVGALAVAVSPRAEAHALAGAESIRIAIDEVSPIANVHWRGHGWRRGYWGGGWGWGWRRPYYGRWGGWGWRRPYYAGWGGWGWRRPYWRRPYYAGWGYPYYGYRPIYGAVGFPGVGVGFGWGRGWGWGWGGPRVGIGFG